MFENLQEKLQRAFKSLRGQAVLTEENIAEAMKQIRLALLEADVNFKVVKDLIDRIQAKAVGQEVLTALSPGEQVIKIVRDELVETLGKDTAKLKFASQPPTVVLMAGLQGSGKTTTSGKLANWLKTGGHRPLLVSVDVYRPAAREQLRVVAAAIKANLYEGEVGDANTATVERLAKEARREAINSGCDVLIVDTAGRLHIDDQLMDEMQSLKRLLNPQEILFGRLLSVGSFPGLKKAAEKVDERQIIRVEAIINPMPGYERNHQEAINGSRRKRIARGSGTSVQEVNNLLRQYAQMRKMFKQMGKPSFARRMAGMKVPGM